MNEVCSPTKKQFIQEHNDNIMRENNTKTYYDGKFIIRVLLIYILVFMLIMVIVLWKPDIRIYFYYFFISGIIGLIVLLWIWRNFYLM